MWSSLVGFFVGIADWNPLGSLIPFHFLDFIGTLATCASYRVCMKNQKHPWLQAFAACCIGMFGGATWLGLLLGQPPGWLNTADSPVAFCLGFWLIFCCPGDLPFWLVSQNRSIEILLGYMRTMGQTHAVSTWGSDVVMAATHVVSKGGSGPLTIFGGFVASCGAGFLVTWLRLGGEVSEWVFVTPPFLKAAGMEGRRAFLLACTYYALLNPHRALPSPPLLEKGEAKTALWLCVVCNFTLMEFFATDLTLRLTDLAAALCFCPPLVGGPLANPHLPLAADPAERAALPLGLSSGYGRQRAQAGARPRRKSSSGARVSPLSSSHTLRRRNAPQ